MPPAAAPMDSRMRRAAQNWNSAGVSSFFRVLGPDRRLILPHVSVPDIRWLDWAALRDAGFRGCVFDKDNTLTEPFSLEVRHELRPALEECLAVFQPLSGVALLSNSAGLAQYDPEGHEAAALETALGLRVIRHARKKPDGSAEEIREHFECPPENLLMIGDRQGVLDSRLLWLLFGVTYMTDILYGNRLGLLTVYTQPLTERGEPLGVRVARRLENALVSGAGVSGTDAPPHPLLDRAMKDRAAPAPGGEVPAGGAIEGLRDANSMAKFLGWVKGKGCW